MFIGRLRYRTASGSDRILRSTGNKTRTTDVEYRHPVATARGSVSS
jgi:hypothetical protein